MSFLGDCIIDISYVAASQTGSIFAIQMSSAPAFSASVVSVVAVPQASGAIQVAQMNPRRKGLIVSNDASGSMYLKYGSSASLSGAGSWTTLIPGRDAPGDSSIDKHSRTWYMPHPIYTGEITAVWEPSVKTGDHAHITDLT